MLVELGEAVQRLRRGELVAIPTETVYGLAGDATNPQAIARIFTTKGRPSDHPLIMHLGAPDWASEWAELPACFDELARRFWPGPLTLVLRRKDGVLDAVTGGQDTVALRVPNHPLTLQLLRDFGKPLVAPSANRFGHTSPTRADHVESEFPGLAVLDGGPCPVGLESTILDLSGDTPRILRPGQIRREDLEALLGPLTGSVENAPRVPGALDRHYAPHTPTVWRQADLPLPARWGWLGFESCGAPVERLLSADADEYGRQLYAALRDLDASGLELIVVEPPPREPRWEAVWDRLRRATHSWASAPRMDS